MEGFPQNAQYSEYLCDWLWESHAHDNFEQTFEFQHLLFAISYKVQEEN